MYPAPPYSPQPYPPPYPAQPYPPPRPAGPRVVGIIGIIFAVIGLGSSAVFTFGPLSDLRRWSSWNEGGDFGAITNWLYAWFALSFVIFVLHIAGSILAINYKSTGLKLLTSYGVSAIILLAIDILLVNMLMPKHTFGLYGSVAVSHMVFSGLALPWPVVVLALVNTRKAREACS